MDPMKYSCESAAVASRSRRASQIRSSRDSNSDMFVLGNVVILLVCRICGLYNAGDLLAQAVPELSAVVLCHS